MITSALEAFDDLVEQVHSSGRDVQGTMEERTRTEAYDYALNANDELFLMTLYDWYLETGKSDQLLEVSAYFAPRNLGAILIAVIVVALCQLENNQQVESYLRHRGIKAGDRRLLWKFYARRNRHYMAAEALRDLALNQE